LVLYAASFHDAILLTFHGPNKSITGSGLRLSRARPFQSGRCEFRLT
jgi:hypothetical protein